MTDKQARALAALLTEPTQKAAAQKAGISARCLRRYMIDPEFSEAYRRACTEFVDNATRQMQRSLSAAVDTLREIAEDPEAGKTARVAAARSILEHGLKYTELADIMGRIAKLEELAGDKH